MATPKVTATSFLKNMGLGSAAAPIREDRTSAPVSTNKLRKAATVPPLNTASVAKPTAGRAGLKHFGGYLDRETIEQIAILRARLSLDNSALIKQAVEELFNRETAARKFGDR